MHDQTPVGRQRNDRIVLVRLLCIFGMIYVHVPAMETTYSFGTSAGFSWFELLRSLLVDGYGRTSACLLSVVSGFLVAKTLNRKAPNYRFFYTRRFKSIYLPMVVWGVVTMLVFSFASIGKTTFISDVCGGRNVLSIDCLNVLFHFKAISTGPTMHLAFLRDLFVCMLLAPALLIVMRYIPVIGLSLLALAYLLDWESVLILRPLVILGFSVGLAIGLRHINFAWVDRLWLCWVFLAILMAMLTTAFNRAEMPQLQWLFATHSLDAREALLYPLTRLFGALAIWSFALKLASTSMMKWAIKLEAILFVSFCSHLLILSMAQEFVGLVITDSRLTMLYPVWFLLAPAFCIVAAVWGVRFCHYVLPNLIHVISGGRMAATVLSKTDLPAGAVPPLLATTRQV